VFHEGRLRTRSEIMAMTRRELVAYLEGDRGTACYKEDTTEDLRESALDEVKE
jgi:hypothetical protein